MCFCCPYRAYSLATSIPRAFNGLYTPFVSPVSRGTVQWSLHPLRFPRFAGDGNPGLSYHWPLTFPSAVDLWFRPFSLLAKVELNDIAKVAIKAESRQKQSTKSPVSSAKLHWGEVTGRPSPSGRGCHFFFYWPKLLTERVSTTNLMLEPRITRISHNS